MDIDEAREKFGRTVENSDGDEVWEPNPNAIRGAVVRYAHAKDCIMAGQEDHDAAEYIDDMWGWLQDKLGEGFEAVFQGDEMSPSGRFDRVGKEKIEDWTNSLYNANDEYRELIDEAWEVTDEGGDEMDTDPVDVDLDGDMASFDAIKEFFTGVEKSYPAKPPLDSEPDIDVYKYHMKQYAVNAEGIESGAESPSAREFVISWVDWLSEYYLSCEGHLLVEQKQSEFSRWATPHIDDVTGWARELWKNDPDFRENVKAKWGESWREVEDVDDSDIGSVTTPQRDRKSNSGGQQALGDYT